MLVSDMIEILPPLGKYKYDTWRILLVKWYIDNFVHLWSCIRNVNKYLSKNHETSSVRFVFSISMKEKYESVQ
jgi:hypothetical protein